MRYLVIFHTFSGVMQLERTLKHKQMIYETMPAPRKISVDCGVAIEFESDDVQKFIEDIKKENIHRIFERKGDDHKIIYEND